MKRLLRQPLLHFFLLGAAIFAVYRVVSDSSARRREDIVVTRGRIDNLVETFSRTWQRPPTETELQGLIADYIREEVAYREALALELDRDDTIVRRRLRQKLEFVSQELAAAVAPTDDELADYLRAHPESFAIEPRFTFRQVYLDPQRHAPDLRRDVDRLRADLEQAGDAVDLAAFGDPFLLESQFEDTSASEVQKVFGEQFLATLSTLTPGKWDGPLTSGYGVHLVFVSARDAGRLPALAEVREAVRREWTNARRMQAHEQFYSALLQRYHVTVETSEPGAQREALAGLQQ